MRTTFDAIVLGMGGIGSAALYRLARRGLRVLGVDRYEPPHDRGSSHGETRIIRKAYFEHPDYVPLAEAALAGWNELGRATRQSLHRTTGLLELGPPAGVVVPGVLQAARQHGLQVEQLTAAEAARRWPGFVADGLAVVYEPDAGVLFVERCVAAHLAAAQAAGAQVLPGVEAFGWQLGKSITLTTAAGAFQTERLIVAAGAWSGALLAELGVPLTPRRQMVTWHDAAPALHADAGCPCFLFELPSGVFYGFPDLGDGLKVGDHAPGAVVDDPGRLDRELHPGDREPLSAFLRERLPGATPAPLRHSACMYTMSPDEHFVLDRHPADERVVLAAGLSGHGFKFAPVLGEALADLAIEGASRLPIDFLSLARFGSSQAP